MNKTEIFAAWAPEHSLWSTWVKPVLFAHLDGVPDTAGVFTPPGDLDGCPPAGDRVALVVDLPGADSVLLGATLAERGYQPVPLYNAVPHPAASLLPASLAGDSVAAVNVWPMVAALRQLAGRMAELPMPPDAPPAFLLDANRQGRGRSPGLDEFDNRSVCFTTDFPSANFLLAQGIRRALLIQRDQALPQADLAHVLRRWQAGGVALQIVRTDVPASPEPLVVPRPTWYGAMFQRALATVGLRHAAGGGFGGWRRDSGAGGGIGSWLYDFPAGG